MSSLLSAVTRKSETDLVGYFRNGKNCGYANNFSDLLRNTDTTAHQQNAICGEICEDDGQIFEDE